jgi:hypothetical protein
VLQLSDDDARLVALAAAYPNDHVTDDFPVGGNLQARCAGFGPNLWAGDDPDAWVSEYVRSEVAAMRRLYG